MQFVYPFRGSSRTQSRCGFACISCTCGRPLAPELVLECVKWIWNVTRRLRLPTRRGPAVTSRTFVSFRHYLPLQTLSSATAFISHYLQRHLSFSSASAFDCVHRSAHAQLLRAAAAAQHGHQRQKTRASRRSEVQCVSSSEDSEGPEEAK